MGYDPFCGRLTDGQLYQRAPLPEEELEDDLRMIPGVGQLMAALAMSGTGTKLTGMRGI